MLILIHSKRWKLWVFQTSVFLFLWKLIIFKFWGNYIENIFKIKYCRLLRQKMSLWDGVYITFSSVAQSCLTVTAWTVAHQAYLSITNSLNLLKLMSIKSVMPSNQLILCCPLLLPSSVFPSIGVFSNKSVLRIRWPKYWSFSFSMSLSDFL